MKRTVYVIDAWNDTKQTSVVLVFSNRDKAKTRLQRIMRRPGRWYAGVLKRTVLA